MPNLPSQGIITNNAGLFTLKLLLTSKINPELNYKAGATTAVVTEKVWGEYVSVVCQNLAKRNTCQKHELRSLKCLI